MESATSSASSSSSCSVDGTILEQFKQDRNHPNDNTCFLLKKDVENLTFTIQALLQQFVYSDATTLDVDRFTKSILETSSIPSSLNSIQNGIVSLETAIQHQVILSLLSVPV